MSSLNPLSMGRRDVCITRWYRSPLAGLARDRWGAVRSVAVLSGRPGMRPHDFCTSQDPVWIAGPRQAEVAAGAVGGCGIRPMPRGMGETTYVTAPNTMIDRTLMTQSRIVI